MNTSELRGFDSVGALVVVLDREGRVVHWNSPCSTLTGYSLDELRGHFYWDFLLVPEEVETAKAVLATLALPGAAHPAHLSNHWLTKSGVRRYITWSNSVQLSDDGTVRHFIKTGIDQTARRGAEAALRLSVAKLSGIIEIAADAIISIDDEQRIVIYNHGAEAIFGWTAAETLGRSFERLLPERFRKSHGQHIRMFGGGTTTTRRMNERGPTIFGLRKNGEEFPAHAAISKLDVGGSLLFTVVLRDITAEVRRDHETALLVELGALSMRRFVDRDETLADIARLVVRNMADCCFVELLAADGTLELMQVHHRDPDKADLCARLRSFALERGRDCLLAVAAESDAPFLLSEVSPRYLESIAESPRQLAALRELDPRSLIAVPIAVRGERLGALLLVSSHPRARYDGQDLQLAQELATRAALSLEHARLHEERERALRDQREANEQLVRATIRAQELADAANAAYALAEERERELRQMAEFRELFIGILGHDLRNPLSSIGLSASLLRKHGHLDARDEKNLTRIIDGGQRMTRMIAQLLDLTRGRLGGGFPLETKLADLGQVCHEVVAEFATPIGVEIAGDVRGIWDRDRLAELLSNIVGNAIEHAEPGTPLTMLAFPDGADVVVEISNRGKPIPREVLPTIFEPFRRARQREKSASGNLGLGLYIAKQIVISHGGTINARCLDGTTTFTIRLPCRLPVAQPATVDVEDVEDAASGAR